MTTAKIPVLTGNRNDSQHAKTEQLHETPVEAMKVLYELEDLPFMIWEPAVGRGAIADFLVSRGHRVVASDIRDYGYPGTTIADFLECREVPDGVDAIVTNPPYGRLLNRFISKAIELVPRTYFLMRIAGIASIGRMEFVNDHLESVYVFSRRLPMMHRDGWEGKRATSAMDHAWFVFTRRKTDQPARLIAVDWHEDEYRVRGSHA